MKDLTPAIRPIVEMAIDQDRCLIFNYEAQKPKSGERIQMPLIKPIGVDVNKDGDSLVIGINLRRVREDMEDISEAVRSYRLDRMQNCMII